jgi:3-methyl-2-oxobutanoate hydroxymethyltransferase
MKTRKNLWFVVPLLAAGVLLGWFGKGFAAGDPTLPGSEGDPLVSRSYVDSKFKMAVVEVPAGASLLGSAGTEIIVRSGTATAIGIPVMGHLGLMPQSIHKYGTYVVRATQEEEAQKLLEDARALEKAGCFSLVLEKIPAALGARVASELKIPVIGIGAGGGVDGQVLVIHDMLGLTQEFSPRFLRRYLNLATEIKGAVANYVKDVKSRDFPNEKEQYD